MKNKVYRIECPEDKKLMGILVPKQKLKSNHIRTFQEGLLEITRDKDLCGDDIRVLLGVLSQMEYENRFTTTLTKLGEEIGLDRSTVSKSTKKLVKKGYLTKEGNQGQVNHYMVDPRIAFKSRVSKFSKVVNRWDDLP